MRFVCERHGSQAGEVVSPDIMEAVDQGRALPRRREIVLELDGVPTFGAIVSYAYAEEHGIPDVPALPVQDEFPPWVLGLWGICEACMQGSPARPLTCVPLSER